MHKIFKILYMRSIKNHVYIIIPILIGCIVSTSLLSATLFIIDNTDNYIHNSAKLLNHGDMSVFQKIHESHSFYDLQYRNMNKEFDFYLDNMEGIEYTFEQHLQPNINAMLNVDGGKSLIGNYWYRYINFEDLSRYADFDEMPAKNSVILCETLAKRLSANVGDIIYIKYNLTTAALKLPISKIIPNSEIILQEASLGYLMIDLSYYIEWFSNEHQEWLNDYEELNGYYDYNNLWVKKYYVDGEAETLKSVETKANEIYGEYARIIYISDVIAQGKEYFNPTIIILSMFALMSFILSSIGLVNLLYIRVIARQKDIVVLKVFGFTNKADTFLTNLDMLILLLPATIIGIFLGYIVFVKMLEETTTMGHYSMSADSLIVSITKIAMIVLAAFVSLIIPNLYFVNKRKIAEVLRENSFSALMKRELIVIIFFSVTLITLLIHVLFQSSIVTKTFLVILIVAFITFLICIASTKLLFLFKGEYLARLSFLFLLKNKSRVPINIITYTICFSVIFLMVIANYSLGSMVSKASFKTYDYNIIITTDIENENMAKQFIDNNLASRNYYIIRGYYAHFNDSMGAELHVYDFANYEGKMKAYIDNKLSAIPYYIGTFELTPGSGIELYVANSPKPVNLIVSDLPEYSSPFPEPRYAMAISSEGIELTDEAYFSSYFLNILSHEKALLFDFIKDNHGMFITNTEDNIEAELGAIRDYKYIFDIMTLFFIVCTFAVLLSSDIVTYLNRMKEFCIFYSLGATLNDIKKIISIENAVILIIGVIYGIIVSHLSLAAISHSLRLLLEMDNIVILLISIMFLLITMLAVFIVLKILPYKSLNDILRDTGRN